MSTDFTKNTMSILGGIIPSSTNTPLDLRTRIATEADIFDIPNPYVGMIVYVEDSGKRFEILTLKNKTIGLANLTKAVVDTYREVTVDLTILATKDELHSHDNLLLLGNIKESDILLWNAKAEVDQIPTKVSQLENDSLFATEGALLDLSVLLDKEVDRAQSAELLLSNRLDVLETINTESKPYISKDGMLVLCGCPAIARGRGNEVHVTTRFFNGEEDKFVFTADEFAKLRICMGYGAEGVGTKRNIAETTFEMYDIDRAYIIDGGSQITGEIGTVNIIAERINYIDGLQGARAMNGGERNTVHNFNIKVKDVKLIDTLFGGGNGFSVVWNSNVEVDGDTTINYLIAGGSNGYVRNSRVVLNNGHAKVMQGVNRGILEKAELIVNGGVVDNFYVAGEVDPSVTGKQNDSYIELNGGVIKNFYPGNSDLVEYKNINGTIMECVVEAGDVSMLTKVEKHPGFVRNDDFAEAHKAMDERVAELEAIDHNLFATYKDMNAKFAAQEKYNISNVPDGTVIDYREKEIRIMCPKDAVFTKQSVGEGGNANMYYMTFTTYFPEEAVAFREGDRGVLVDEYLNFEDTAGTGVDRFGRKFKQHWFALANFNGTDWNYFGKTSSVDKYIGWTYCVEYYNAQGEVIGSDCIRLNLSNEDCHNTMEPYYGFRIASMDYVVEQIATHDHDIISDAEIDNLINQ